MQNLAESYIFLRDALFVKYRRGIRH